VQTNTRVDPRTGLESLDRDECLQLMQGCAIGRLVVVLDGRPLVFPVNFTLDGSAVVLRTDAGTKLHAVRDSEVAFECDHADRTYHTGWSVILTGRAEEVHNRAEIARLERLPLGPWCAGPKPVWLRITPHTITGRRIPPHGMQRGDHLDEGVGQ